jgi:hypothetical protein
MILNFTHKYANCTFKGQFTLIFTLISESGTAMMENALKEGWEYCVYFLCRLEIIKA